MQNVMKDRKQPSAVILQQVVFYNIYFVLVAQNPIKAFSL